ncbi:hypothetical protein G9A89_020457 [Geosiphon pyriformis]|nr:hypothetical protein G9A89_020457 [Geosiphon pyriformis]
MSHQIGIIVNRNHFTTAIEIMAQLAKTYSEIKISEQIIRDELSKLGYTDVLSRCISLLTEQAKQNRLHNNNPKHTSKDVRADLEMQLPNCILSWPSYSSDLNPIENIWAILKRNVEKKGSVSGLNLSSSCISQLLSLCAFNNTMYNALCKSFVFREWYLEAVSVFGCAKTASKKVVELVQDLGMAHWVDV